MLHGAIVAVSRRGELIWRKIPRRFFDAPAINATNPH